ncbi:MAG: response regulator [Terriglobales bacterium]
MLGRRLLLVDDDRTLLECHEAVFQRQGFETTSASTVREALYTIASQPFDIVVTDLNIGEPGDGFTIVSALRRTNPNSAALIITGYPAFDSALEAIRKQVDDYLIKPVPAQELIATVERVRTTRNSHVPVQKVRASKVVRENYAAIEKRWLERVKDCVEALNHAVVEDALLLDHLPHVIEELCNRVDEQRTATAPQARENATAHGLLRLQQEFDAMFVFDEGSCLREELLAMIHQNLLRIDLSTLLTDLAAINTSLDDQLKLSMYATLSNKPFGPNTNSA